MAYDDPVESPDPRDPSPVEIALLNLADRRCYTAGHPYVKSNPVEVQANEYRDLNLVHKAYSQLRAELLDVSLPIRVAALIRAIVGLNEQPEPPHDH